MLTNSSTTPVVYVAISTYALRLIEPHVAMMCYNCGQMTHAGDTFERAKIKQWRLIMQVIESGTPRIFLDGEGRIGSMGAGAGATNAGGCNPTERMNE